MNLEQALLAFVENISNTDFSLMIMLIQFLFIGFWIIVVGWIWVDSGERTTNLLVRVTSTVLVAVFNVVGLIVYLIVRSKQTIQDLYWADLERRYLKYETSELGDCPNCKLSFQPGFNICPRCGYDIKKQCKGCNIWVDKSYRFCPFCRAPFEDVVKVTEKVESVEQMATEVNKAKEEAIKVVEGDQTKYVDRHGVVSKVRKDFAAFVKDIGDRVLGKKKVKSTPKPNKKKGNKKKN